MFRGSPDDDVWALLDWTMRYAPLTWITSSVRALSIQTPCGVQAHIGSLSREVSSRASKTTAVISTDCLKT